jgi:hypothetical protein
MSTTEKPVATLRNVAIFVRRLGGSSRRVYQRVDLEVGESLLRVLRSGREVQTYPIVATAKELMAWDATDATGLIRLVAQEGCGCGGMRRYANDEGYDGPFSA